MKAIFATALTFAASALPALAQNVINEDMVAVGGNQLSVACRGTGPKTVLLVAGMGLDARTTYKNTFRNFSEPGYITGRVIVVDRHGNAIVAEPDQKVHTSPDGNFQQVIGSDGKPTGDRMDRCGHPGRREPLAQKPHGHRAGITRANGNPHLPIHSGDHSS